MAWFGYVVMILIWELVKYSSKKAFQKRHYSCFLFASNAGVDFRLKYLDYNTPTSKNRYQARDLAKGQHKSTKLFKENKSFYQT